MAGKDAIEVEGTVLETDPNMIYKVEMPNGHIVSAHLSGKMRDARITVLPGEKVMLVMSPYDLSKGQIAFRKN